MPRLDVRCARATRWIRSASHYHCRASARFRIQPFHAIMRSINQRCSRVMITADPLRLQQRSFDVFVSRPPKVVYRTTSGRKVVSARGHSASRLPGHDAVKHVRSGSPAVASRQMRARGVCFRERIVAFLGIWTELEQKAERGPGEGHHIAKAKSEFYSPTKPTIFSRQSPAAGPLRRR